MALYRLDSLEGPVTDLLGPVLIRRYATARERAIQAAADRGGPVNCTRIGTAGSLTRAFTAHPDGRVTRPSKPPTFRAVGLNPSDA